MTQMIILTKSYKSNGFCISGINKETGEFIRPIQRETKDGAIEREKVSKLYLFDIIEIKGLEVPAILNKIQKENRYFDESVGWKKIGKATIEDVLDIHPANRLDSIFYSDSYCSDSAKCLGDSLLLAQIYNVKIYKKINQNTNKEQIKIDFTYQNKKYFNFQITCPSWEYEDKIGKQVDELLVVISLGNEYEGKCFKFIASIL